MRISLANKFKRIADKIKLNNGAVELFNKLIDNSRYGVVNRDTLEKIPGSHVLYLEELSDKSLITYNRAEMALFLNPYNTILYNSLTVEKKRKYIKTSVEPLLQGIKFNGILFRENDTEEIIYTTKTKGIKIPDRFRPYLTSEPMSKYEIISHLKNGILELEESRRNLTKEQKIVFCTCIHYANTNGNLTDFNCYKFYRSIQKEYPERTYSYTTINTAVQYLIKLGLLRISSGNLKVVGYQEAFEQKEHYIIIPDVINTLKFKRLQTSAVKLFFDFIFKLNNGEKTKDKFEGQHKAVFFKFRKGNSDDIKSKKEFDEDLLWLRKRYSNELRDIIFGDITEQDYSALAEFFHFTTKNKIKEFIKNPSAKNNDENVLMVRIRKEYFISKKAELLKPLLALSKKDKDKLDAIEQKLKERNIPYTDKQLVDIVQILKNESTKVIDYLLSMLAERLKQVDTEGYKPIGSIVAYLRSRYKSMGTLWT